MPFGIAQITLPVPGHSAPQAAPRRDFQGATGRRTEGPGEQESENEPGPGGRSGSRPVPDRRASSGPGRAPGLRRARSPRCCWSGPAPGSSRCLRRRPADEALEQRGGETSALPVVGDDDRDLGSVLRFRSGRTWRRRRSSRPRGRRRPAPRGRCGRPRSGRRGRFRSAARPARRTAGSGSPGENPRKPPRAALVIGPDLADQTSTRGRGSLVSGLVRVAHGSMSPCLIA